MKHFQLPKAIVIAFSLVGWEICNLCVCPLLQHHSHSTPKSSFLVWFHINIIWDTYNATLAATHLHFIYQRVLLCFGWVRPINIRGIKLVSMSWRSQTFINPFPTWRRWSGVFRISIMTCASSINSFVRHDHILKPGKRQCEQCGMR